MNILLVVPWDKKHGSYRSRLSFFIAYKPLTLPTLAALVPEELHAAVDVCDEMTDHPQRYKKHYDIVAFSIVSCESHRAYQLAEQFKQRGSYIVFGGYHMLYNSNEGFQHADTVIVGAAEQSWPQFLREFAAGSPQRFYHQPCIDPSMYVTPKRNVLPSRRYVPLPTVLANPSCRRNCNFCAICKMWNAKPRPVKDVIQDIRDLKRKYYIFYDPNFFDDREYAIELMNAMCDLHISWAGAGCVDVFDDDELLALAQKSGCAGLLLGLESMSEKALENSRKGFNSPEQYKKAVEKFQSYGISINGCFVLGMDGDTEENLRQLPYWVDYLGLNLARFALLTPMPGSELYCQLDEQGRILSKSWEHYTQNQVVFQPQNMAPDRLKQIYDEVWKETYKWSAVIKRVKRIKTSTFREKMIVFLCNVGFKYLGKEM